MKCYVCKDKQASICTDCIESYVYKSQMEIEESNRVKCELSNSLKKKLDILGHRQKEIFSVERMQQSITSFEQKIAKLRDDIQRFRDINSKKATDNSNRPKMVQSAKDDINKTIEYLGSKLNSKILEKNEQVKHAEDNLQPEVFSKVIEFEKNIIPHIANMQMNNTDYNCQLLFILLRYYSKIKVVDIDVQCINGKPMIYVPNTNEGYVIANTSRGYDMMVNIIRNFYIERMVMGYPSPPSWNIKDLAMSMSTMLGHINTGETSPYDDADLTDNLTHKVFYGKD